MNRTRMTKALMMAAALFFTAAVPAAPFFEKSLETAVFHVA